MTNGFLVVNKPAGITSHDVVAAVRAVTGLKKVGHTGTLDPFATGVLPLALGRATRLIQYLDESIKVYDATIRFGTKTDTGDPTGQIIEEAPSPEATDERVAVVLQGFLGDQLQTPPAYSAVKVKGKPLYHYARKGEKVEVKARPIVIHKLEVLHRDADTLRILITCGRGTYARVLANDIAEALGSVGHLEVLARRRSGPFFLEEAIDMPTLSGLVAAEEGHEWSEVLMARRGGARVKWRPRSEVFSALEPWIRSPIKALNHLPMVDVAAPDAQKIRHGVFVPAAPAGLAVGGRFLVVQGEQLVAIAEHTVQGSKSLRGF